MKITRSQLRRIIQEEKAKQSARTISEIRSPKDLWARFKEKRDMVGFYKSLSSEDRAAVDDEMQKRGDPKKGSDEWRKTMMDVGEAMAMGMNESTRLTRGHIRRLVIEELNKV